MTAGAPSRPSALRLAMPVAAIIALLLAGGCLPKRTAITSGGAGVTVVQDAAKVEGCTRVGRFNVAATNLMTAAEQELDVKARNRTAELGGDTALDVRPSGAARREYEPYRCAR